MAYWSGFRQFFFLHVINHWTNAALFQWKSFIWLKVLKKDSFELEVILIKVQILVHDLCKEVTSWELINANASKRLLRDHNADSSGV